MDNLVSLELIFIHETDAAILVKDEEDGPANWIPKAHCEYDDSVLVPGMMAIFDIQEGAAIEAGLV